MVKTRGLTHVHLAVRDLELAVRDVVREGGSLVKRGEHQPGHPYAYVADPDGYVIEL